MAWISHQSRCSFVIIIIIIHYCPSCVISIYCIISLSKVNQLLTPSGLEVLPEPTPCGLEVNQLLTPCGLEVNQLLTPCGLEVLPEVLPEPTQPGLEVSLGVEAHGPVLHPASPLSLVRIW